MLSLKLLGRPRIARHNEIIEELASNKVLVLLCYLATNRGQHTRQRLAGLLWGAMAEERAKANLRMALYDLQKWLPGYFQVTRKTVAFDHEQPYSLDVETFEQLAAMAQEPAELEKAADCYQGAFLEGVFIDDAPELNEWLRGEQERLRLLVLAVLNRLVDECDRQGAWLAGTAAARRLLAIEPWHEQSHRHLMRFLARQGMYNSALQQYETCRQLLIEELNVEPMPETTTLYRRIQAIRTAPKSNLPEPATPFIGRENELAELAERLHDPACRLLTISGPGGIGKSRLALQLARQQVSWFLDGIYFVPLAGVEEQASIIPAIGEAIGFSFMGKEAPAAQLLTYLQSKEMLLVLDNFEHLLPGAALLALLLAAPELKLLVTSRERLQLREEWFFEIDGLPYPAPEQVMGLADYSSVQLFQQTAQRVDHRFAAADNLRETARICSLLEGLPLGIELAATLVATRSCQEIASEIENNLDLLTASYQDMPDRQRSLRATFDYSWWLLSVEEQQSLCAIAIFRGGFTQEGAAVVSGTGRRLLDRLVARSLLRRSAAGGRYEMHPLLRHFAAEKLVEAAETAKRTEQQYLAYYAGYVQVRVSALAGSGQRPALAEIEAEIENIQAAWRLAAAHREQDAIEAALVGLALFYEMRSRFVEGARDFELAAAAFVSAESDEGKRLHGRLLARQAQFLIFLGRYDEAVALLEESDRRLAAFGEGVEQVLLLLAHCQIATDKGNYQGAEQAAEEALALSQRLSDLAGQAQAHALLGNAHQKQGSYQAARMHYEQFEALCVMAGNEWQLTKAYSSLGVIAGAMGDYAEAEMYLRHSLELCRLFADRMGQARALSNLSNIAYIHQDYEQARQIRLEVLEICRDIGFRWGIASIQRHLADTVRRLGQTAEAERYYRQSLQAHQEMGDTYGVAFCYNSLGNAAREQGKYEQAKIYSRKAITMAMELGVRPLVLAAIISLAETLAETGQREIALTAITFALRQPALEKQTLLQAQPLAERFFTEMPPEIGVAAQMKGETLAQDEQGMATMIELLLAIP